jgi:hypothetical protein
MIPVEKQYELLNNYWRVRMSPEEIASQIAWLSSSDLYDLVEVLKTDYPMVYSMLSADIEYV